MSVHKRRFFQAYILLIAVVAILNRGGEGAVSFRVGAAPLPAGLDDSTSPTVGNTVNSLAKGAVNPLAEGTGAGIARVAGVAAGTQPKADSNEATEAFLRSLGAIDTSSEQGAGTVVANHGTAAAQSEVLGGQKIGNIGHMMSVLGSH